MACTIHLMSAFQLFCCLAVSLSNVRGSRMSTREIFFKAFFEVFFFIALLTPISQFFGVPSAAHERPGCPTGSKMEPKMDPQIDFFENSEMSFGYGQCYICSTLGLPKPIPKRDYNQSSHQEAPRTSLLSIRTVLFPHFADFCTKVEANLDCYLTRVSSLQSPKSRNRRQRCRCYSHVCRWRKLRKLRNVHCY